MAQVDNLQKYVQQILDSMRTYVEESCDITWKDKDDFLIIALISIIRRQFDSLEVISHLVKEGKGFAAGPLLRPACEEFIWMKYLVSIESDDAKKIINYLGVEEQLKSLRAQDNFAGRSVTEDLGLLPYLENMESLEKNMYEKLRCLGKRLDWPQRNIAKGQFPSISWLAKRNNQQDIYDFIYHATSRFVHFSVNELCRRAWGDPYTGSISIRSTHFQNYWGQFSLHWGLILFLDTVTEFDQFLEVSANIDQTTFLEAAERISKIGKPPIITAEELYWPKDH